MNKALYTGLLFFLIFISHAQTRNDINYLTGSSLSGSARYISMGGAFGALGGDVSAISDNPAGSSVFLNTEIGGTINYNNFKFETVYLGNRSNRENELFNFDQFGAVFVFNNKNSKNPWKRISASINVNRIASFENQFTLNGVNTNSIADYFLYYADGIDFENIQLYDDESIAEVYRLLGNDIGYGAQQAFLGYQSYIIDPISNNPYEQSYISNIESSQNRHYLNVINNGFHRKTSFNFSGLYQNILHLGFNINQHRIDFINDQEFFEGEQDLNSFIYDVSFDNKLISYGEGFSLQFGTILKLNNIRLGLSYDSPQWFEINDETIQKISSYRYDGEFEIKENINPEITNTYRPYNIKIPSKVSASFAYVFNERGLFSIEYSSQNLSNSYLSDKGASSYLDEINLDVNNVFLPINTFKVGGEYRFKKVNIRAGFYSRSKNQNFVRNNDQAITFGFGFNFRASAINFSFIQYDQNKKFQLFSRGLIDSYDLNKKLSQLSISYNFKL